MNLTEELRALHPAVLTRVLHLWLTGRHRQAGIDAAIIDAATAMLQAGGPAKINLPGGRHLRRKARRLWVQ